ncbi:MAG: DUF3445 domain-containing protein [Paracoccaceae bacterium]
MPEILHNTLPFKPWMAEKTRKLPGIQPLNPADWLLRDEVFSAQMAYRDQLLANRRAQVFQATPNSLAAQHELLETVITALDTGYIRHKSHIMRPDNVQVSLDDTPIITAARLVQEDLLILENGATEPELTAAVLCFPASWTLDEKFTQGMRAIHGNVIEYTPDMAKRVHRMFDALRPEQPLWRANFLIYSDADLFQPRAAGQDKPRKQGQGGYIRVERQSLRKLPRTGAVVFGIHTYIMALSKLSVVERRLLEDSLHKSSQGLTKLL